MATPSTVAGWWIRDTNSRRRRSIAGRPAGISDRVRGCRLNPRSGLTQSLRLGGKARQDGARGSALPRRQVLPAEHGARRRHYRSYSIAEVVTAAGSKLPSRRLAMRQPRKPGISQRNQRDVRNRLFRGAIKCCPGMFGARTRHRKVTPRPTAALTFRTEPTEARSAQPTPKPTARPTGLGRGRPRRHPFWRPHTMHQLDRRTHDGPAGTAGATGRQGGR